MSQEITHEISKEIIARVSEMRAQYGETTILHDVSFELPANEILVVLGTSGCGKSTLLKHMIGLMQPASGNVEIFGRSLNDLEETDWPVFYQNMGVMFQYGALLNSLTVGENVGVPLEQHTDLPPELIEHIVRQKLDLVDLGHAYDLLPNEISGGMRKRAAIARAIAMEPRLLFGDEPSAGLDPVTAANLDRLILNLKEKLAMTIVIVTHELESIRTIADRILYLDEGSILFHGKLADALSSGIPQIEKFFNPADRGRV